MKRKILTALFILLCSVSLSACGLNETGALMSDARDFIEKGDYDKAMTNLSKVLSEDETNTEARGMYYQALKLKKAVRYDSRQNYEQEIKELNDLINDNSGSAKVRSQAEEMLEKAQDAYQKQKKAVITRKENAKKTAEENKGKYAAGTTYSSGYQYKSYSSQKNTYNYNSKKTTGTNSTTNNGYTQGSSYNKNAGQGSGYTQNGVNSQSGQTQSTQQ